MSRGSNEDFQDFPEPRLFQAGVVEGDLPLVAEVIDNLGVGWAQAKVVCIGCSCYFAAGAHVLLMTTVNTTVSEDWHLSASQRALIVSFIFLGLFFGNFLSGPMGDMYGRKLPILISIAGSSIFMLLAAFSWNFTSLGILNFFVGLFLGVGSPAYQAMASESSPTHWRGAAVSAGSLFFCVGEMYSCALIMIDDTYMNNLHWRWLLIMGAVPVFLFLFFAFFFLAQSPLYLACHGFYEETTVVLDAMRRDNCVPDVSINFRQTIALAQTETRLGLEKQILDDAKAFFQQLWRPFTGDLLLTTVILIYSAIVLNFIYFGTLYALPQILGEISLEGLPSVQLLWGVVWEILGNILGVICTIYFPRKRAISASLVLVTISITVFMITSPHRENGMSGGHLLLHLSYFGIKFFTAIGFNVLYVYAAEVTPTVARTSGVAVVVAGGRIASILSPSMFEGMMQLTHNYQTFFFFMVIAGIINLVLFQVLPFETFGKQLQDSMEEKEKFGTVSRKGYGGVASSAGIV